MRVAIDTRQGLDASTVQRNADHEDHLLVVRVAARDAQAFRVLVDRHLSGIVTLARRMLRDDAEAEDVAQETFLRLWRAGDDLELGAGGIRPWLRRVASNMCIDKIRAGRRLDVTDDVPEQVEPASQLRGLEQRELGARVQLGLDGLAERQRLALTLFHYEGRSLSEIGDVLGVSAEAVESLLARARRSLKSALALDWQALRPGHSDDR